MINTESGKENVDYVSNNFTEIYNKDGLEQELERYTQTAIDKINFTLIIKPALISFVALIISFFLDLSTVPILGNITIKIAQAMFPNWQPDVSMISPYKFWWALPVIVYALFVFLAYLAYNKLKVEIVRTPASETIDRIITSYTSVIDSISTALPLIGAAILLISIQLGEEVFLGLSVPFEVKALIVLALGKLFEPVLDQLGVDFQNVVNHVSDIKDRYFSRIQIENSKNLLKQVGGGSGSSIRGAELTLKDLESYRNVLEETAGLSELLQRNFDTIHNVLEKINSIQGITPEKIEQLKDLAKSITEASNSLGDEKTQAGLKHLESIIIKR
jgi:regulator of sigma D